MSTRTWGERLTDIIDAITEINTYTVGMEFDVFRDDFRTIRAVELNFIVIGEAASRIPENIQLTYPDIPWSFMKALRNRLVHAYFDIDAKVLWDTIHRDLPPLMEVLARLSASLK